MKIGDTFVWCPGIGPDHLWILISDPGENGGKCILVNLTESVHGKYSFILKPGQHRFIYKDSDVAFGDAIQTGLKELEKRLKIDSASPHDPMSPQILASIIREARTHAAFPPHMRKYLPAV